MLLDTLSRTRAKLLQPPSRFRNADNRKIQIAAPEKSSCARDRRWPQRRPARRKVNASLFLLQVPAEFVTHRREQLVRKIGGAARAETLIECGSEHLRRHALVDRGVDRPAALA